MSAPDPSPEKPTTGGAQSLSVGVVCALGFVSIIAVVALLETGVVHPDFPLALQLLPLGVPIVFGIATIVLAAFRLRGARRVVALILGFLLVVWPVWGIIVAVFLSCSGVVHLVLCD